MNSFQLPPNVWAIATPGTLGDVAPEECNVWVQQPGNRMRHLRHRCREAIAIAAWAIARSAEVAARGHLSTVTP